MNTSYKLVNKRAKVKDSMIRVSKRYFTLSTEFVNRVFRENDNAFRGSRPYSDCYDAVVMSVMFNSGSWTMVLRVCSRKVSENTFGGGGVCTFVLMKRNDGLVYELAKQSDCEFLNRLCEYLGVPDNMTVVFTPHSSGFYMVPTSLCFSLTNKNHSLSVMTRSSAVCPSALEKSMTTDSRLTAKAIADSAVMRPAEEKRETGVSRTIEVMRIKDALVSTMKALGVKELHSKEFTNYFCKFNEATRDYDLFCKV